MKKLLFLLLLLLSGLQLNAQQRRPIDSEHPMWLVHVDVWNKADPQKIIDLIPEQIRPYVVMNLSLSCGFDVARDVYKMPQNAVKTYRSWASVCQHNGMWFTCQPASGGHTHLKDDDLETFEYFFKRYPNFLGWNFAEQFWGFDEAGDRSSSSQVERIALFAKLVEMSHNYGGVLTISFCGNIWSHALNPVGMMKRNADLKRACEQYPEAILWLYKYTTSSCFYNNESVTWSPFVAGLAKNYGVRYDNCGWNGALDALLGEGHGRKYPVAAGIGTVMEQTCVNGGAVWDGPELIWTEDFQNLSNGTENGYTVRRWGTFPGFRNAWLDMFDKIIDGTMYIPTREEVVAKTHIYVINDKTSGNDEDKYAAWGDLYDNLYKQTDPFNRNNGQWMDNFCYFKKTGRYGAVPVGLAPFDSLAQTIDVKVKKSQQASHWSSQAKKTAEFNKYYPVVSTGDLYVNRYRNQLVTYTPYTYLNNKSRASAQLPLLYNTCDSLRLSYGLLSSGIIHEYADHISLYLNNYRTDVTDMVLDKITVVGCTSEPTFTANRRVEATLNATSTWDAATGVFELSIRHNGGVDVDICCAGAATDRATDVVPNTALGLPKQPEPYHGPVTIEAEDMNYKNIKSCVTDPFGWYPSVFGHAGNGFMDMGTNTQGALQHKIKLSQGGAYRISVRYTNTNKVGSMLISVNGHKYTKKFAKTVTNEWAYVVVDADMNEGQNTLLITNTSGISCYIDNVTYCPAELPEEKFSVVIRDTEHGHVVSSVDTAAEGETVMLQVTTDPGFRLTGWKCIHGGVMPAADGSFVMPDDNVTLMPIFEDMTVVYTLDFTPVLSGTLPAGWRCEQEDGVHEYPNNYSAGARTFQGFTGYQGKALYWREVCCEYGRQSAYPLTLTPGNYKLTWAMAAWKEAPKYQARILDANGHEVATSPSITASPNAAGNTGASLKSAQEQTLEFTVETEGNYVISFVNLDAIPGFDEFLLLECNVNLIPTAGINEIREDEDSNEGLYYDLMGRRMAKPARGQLFLKR